MWRLPDAVGGGVSTAKRWSFPRARADSRLKRYVPSASQRVPQASSSPSRAGLSGIAPLMGNLLRYRRHRVHCALLVLPCYKTKGGPGFEEKPRPPLCQCLVARPGVGGLSVASSHAPCLQGCEQGNKGEPCENDGGVPPHVPGCLPDGEGHRRHKA